MLLKNRSFFGIVVFFCFLLGLTLGQTSIASQTGLEMDSALISLDVRQMSLPDVLRLIADKANINIIVGREVTEADVVITLRLKNVDLWQALEAVLKVRGFGYLEENGIIRIIKLEKLVEAKPPLVTEINFLKYAEVEKVKTVCQFLLSPSGTIEIDFPTNALIIKDTSGNIEKIRQVIAELDVEPLPMLVKRQFQLNYINVVGEEEKDLLETVLGAIVGEEGTFLIDSLTNSIYVEVPPPCIKEIEDYLKEVDVPAKRIMIKAEFVEVRLHDDEELGIKWRWKGAYGNYPLGATFRYPYYTRAEPGEVVSTPRAPLSTLSGLGIIFGSIEQEFRALVDMLISEDRADLISSPSIVTLDGKEARIHVGDKYPYKIKSWKEGELFESTEFIDLGATLLVTPYIKGGNRIVLDIHSRVSEITAKSLWEGGPPVVGDRDTKTQIEMEDGETIVIGGLFRDNEKETRTGIPFLSRLPIIGALFTHKTTEKERTDLLVLITPYVLPEMGEENIAEKLKLTKTKVEAVHQEGLSYKKTGEYEKARECFERVVNESRAYGFSDYLETAEKELANLDELDELEKSRLELEEKKQAEKLEKVKELELKEKRIDKVESEVKIVRKDHIFGIGLGQWFSSMNGDSFMTYEAQLFLKGNVRLFSGAVRTSDQSSSVAYFGAQIGDKLNIGIGGIQSGPSEKVNLMLTTGFSLGTAKLRLEGSYLYVPKEKGSSGTKVMLAIAF